jgi:hypothetical protein
MSANGEPRLSVDSSGMMTTWDLETHRQLWIVAGGTCVASAPACTFRLRRRRALFFVHAPVKLCMMRQRARPN